MKHIKITNKTVLLMNQSTSNQRFRNCLRYMILVSIYFLTISSQSKTEPQSVYTLVFTNSKALTKTILNLQILILRFS